MCAALLEVSLISVKQGCIQAHNWNDRNVLVKRGSMQTVAQPEYIVRFPFVTSRHSEVLIARSPYRLRP
jgi:hypothetical protein